jgi:hypothetical protein
MGSSEISTVPVRPRRCVVVRGPDTHKIGLVACDAEKIKGRSSPNVVILGISGRAETIHRARCRTRFDRLTGKRG